MWCASCESNPCTCQRQLTAVLTVREWELRYCSVEGCWVQIRTVPGIASSEFCRWHNAGMAFHGNLWPCGMPSPELTWPWKTQAEREQQAGTAYWQARFRMHAAKYPAYQQWIRVKP